MEGGGCEEGGGLADKFLLSTTLYTRTRFLGLRSQSENFTSSLTCPLSSYVYISVPWVPRSVHALHASTRVNIHKYVHAFTCTHTNTRAHTHTFVHAHAHSHTNTHTHTYTLTHSLTRLQVLQRKRRRTALKKRSLESSKSQAAEYHKLLVTRLKEQRERRWAVCVCV
jgi:hypothetical protein